MSFWGKPEFSYFKQFWTPAFAWVALQGTFYEIINIDGLVKSRHSRAGGNPEFGKLSKRLDSRLRGNDGKGRFQTFYEIINITP
jgi:hypothetical protein